MRIAIAGAVLILSCAFAAPAHAFSGPLGDQSDNAFWVDIAPYNGDGKVTVSKAGQLAQSICGQLESGQSEGEIVAGVANSEDNGATTDVAAYQAIVDAAEWHFCPAYY
jgi:hypothetical protein